MDVLDIRLKVSSQWHDILELFPINISHIIKEQCYVAGGVFKSIALNEFINDWDIWCRNEESSLQLLSLFSHLFQKLDSSNSCALTNKKKLNFSKILLIRDKVVTVVLPGTKLQFIFTDYGEPEKIIKGFDFKHTQCFYDPISRELECPLEWIINKTLCYNAEYTKPLQAVKRAFKFIKQGWIIPESQLDGMISKLAGIDWTNPIVLKEQTERYYAEPVATGFEQPEGPPTSPSIALSPYWQAEQYQQQAEQYQQQAEQYQQQAEQYQQHVYQQQAVAIGTTSETNSSILGRVVQYFIS